MSHNRPFRQLISYMRPHRITVFFATLFSILNKLFDLAPPFLSKMTEYYLLTEMKRRQFI